MNKSILDNNNNNNKIIPGKQFSAFVGKLNNNEIEDGFVFVKKTINTSALVKILEVAETSSVPPLLMLLYNMIFGDGAINPLKYKNFLKDVIKAVENDNHINFLAKLLFNATTKLVDSCDSFLFTFNVNNEEITVGENSIIYYFPRKFVGYVIIKKMIENAEKIISYINNYYSYCYNYITYYFSSSQTEKTLQQNIEKYIGEAENTREEIESDPTLLIAWTIAPDNNFSIYKKIDNAIDQELE